MDLPVPDISADLPGPGPDVPGPAASNPDPPVRLAAPDRQAVPLVFASPHSGRNYPPGFVAATRLDPLSLRRSEDCFVDELFEAAPSLGVPLLSATFPRAFCDPNREAWELDPAMFHETLPDWVNTTSPRVVAGLGTIARVVGSGETIYREKLRFSDAEERIKGCWQPFHDRLQDTIRTTLAQFGRCLLIDCHSMPGTSMAPKTPADFVLGDAHGTACAPRTTRRVERVLSGMGYQVRHNDPYAGGYITRHYGRPREGVHVLQLEINRRLYMDEALIERLPRFGRLKDDMTALIKALVAYAGEPDRP